MDWGQRIRGWEGWRAIREWRVRESPVREWDGWRRYGPAAGSVVAHGVVGLAIVSMIGASVKPRPAAPTLPPQLEVMLVSETPMPSMRPTPPKTPPRPRAPDAEPIPDKQRSATPRKEATRAPEAATDASDADAVYIPPSILSEGGVPPGLQGLVNADRCNPKKGLKPKDCGTQWSAKIEQASAWQTASKNELKQHYRAFMPVCPYKVGCEPTDGVLLNGARSFGLKSPMASGAGGLGGIHDLVGRLGFNPDHTDPGFGD